eukprot:gene9274-10252_t
MKQKWTWHHVTVFILTFLGYALFHACRKAFSNVKDSMRQEFTPTNNTCPIRPKGLWEKRHFFEDKDDANIFLGEMDTVFLMAYAVGLYISGFIGDRLNMRIVLTFGMISSSVVFFLFGYVSAYYHIYNKYYYAVFFMLNGLFQSTGWPTTVAIMGNWFSKSTRGSVFGFWSGNASLGNIIGSLMVASVLDYGYEYGFLVTSFLLFCGGFMMFFCLITKPEDIGLEPPRDEDDNDATVTTTAAIENDGDEPYDQGPLLRDQSPSCNNDAMEQPSIESKTGALGFFKALLLPGVIPYSLSYACLKMVNYSFFFWLPTYLAQGLHWKDKKSDELSNFYDLGGIFGGIIAGVVSDRLGYRSPVVSTMLLLSMGSLFLYSNTGAQYDTNVGLMTLTGFMIGGPANLISSAISADLGKQDALKTNLAALATVTGIIDGTGSVGAAIGQYLVPVINKAFGWHTVFYFLIVMTFLSLVCLIPMMYRDAKRCTLFKRKYVVLEGEI